MVHPLKKEMIYNKSVSNNLRKEQENLIVRIITETTKPAYHPNLHAVYVSAVHFWGEIFQVFPWSLPLIGLNFKLPFSCSKSVLNFAMAE